MWAYVAYVALGLVAGFLSALFGIGGGVILVPTLILVLAVPAKAATATSLAYIIPIAIFGCTRQWYMGQDIRWLYALLAVPLGLVGAEVGSRAKQHLSSAQLQVLFGLLLVCLGVYLALQGRAAMRAQSPASSAAPASASTPPAPPS